MKTKIIITGLIAIIINSCTSPKYLPSSENIDVNQFGSYININIKHKTTSHFIGELISIDSNQITILKKTTNKCVSIPLTDIKCFKLRYAKPKHYGWTIPVFTIATISHGVYLIITGPINLIVTISVTASGESAFKYSNKNMNYDKLKMFARFPQGIPKNIDIASIK